jgi:hypothetical protein
MGMQNRPMPAPQQGAPAGKPGQQMPQPTLPPWAQQRMQQMQAQPAGGVPEWAMKRLPPRTPMPAPAPVAPKVDRRAMMIAELQKQFQNQGGY